MTEATHAKTGSSKRTTKKTQLIAMLERKKGATIAAVSNRFGWQRHTTRAALTGLRKAGYAIELRKPEGGGAGTYHISKEPVQAAA